MANVVFDFNPTVINREDVGATFKALAQNMQQQADLAAQEKRIHLSQSAQADALARSYKDRAEATAVHAANVLRGATNRLFNAQQRMKAYELSKKHNTAEDFLKLSISLAKAKDFITAGEIDQQVVRGVLDGVKERDDLLARIDQDPESVASYVENLGEQWAKHPDDPYLKTKLKYLLPLHTKASALVEDNRRRIVASTYLAYLEANGFDIDPKVTEEYARAHNVPISLLRDTEFGYVNKKFAERISQVSSRVELEKLLSEYSGLMKKRYDNKYLLQSNSPQTQELVRATQKEINNAITQAEQRIKDTAYSALAYMDANPTDPKVTPKLYAQALQETGANPLQIEKQTKSFIDKQNQALYDQKVIANFTVASNESFDRAFKDLSDDAKDVVLDKASTELVDYLAQGDTDHLTKALKVNPDIVSKVSKRILTTFNNLSGVGKQQFYLTLRKAIGANDNVKGLSNLIKDSSLATILSAGTLVELSGVYDKEGLDVEWQKALNMVASKPKSERLPLNRHTDENLFNNMVEDASKMGVNGKRFMNLITQIYGNIGERTENVYDDIKEYFTQMQHVSTYPTSFENLPEYKIVEYTTHAPDPFKDLPDEDFANEVKSKVLDKVREGLIKKGLNPTFHSIEYLPNNIMVFRDSFGGVIDVVDVTDVLKAEEHRYMVERQHKVTFGDVARVIGNKGAQVVDSIHKWTHDVTEDTRKAAEHDKFMQTWSKLVKMMLGGMAQ